MRIKRPHLPPALIIIDLLMALAAFIGVLGYFVGPVALACDRIVILSIWVSFSLHQIRLFCRLWKRRKEKKRRKQS
ncbi:MAG: hypothetical protein A2444_03670 [Candidatus Staskawiczbacteria bacterium RIFOXYC2_FULL_37_19]|nr:MAG: hypothetical protein A2444_03670 [Candidatus Staskawiczbacteria bacterium RIFOXYC2_FULL_37_19]